MSRITLTEAVSAPLQEDTENRYGTGTHAVLVRGEFFYYRPAEHYRDWIEVFTHRGDSLGSFRSLDHFIGEWPGRHREAAPNTEARALLAQIRPLVGHRIVEVGIEEIDTGLSPAPVLRFDDGRVLAILADPEGNGGGFPDIIKP